MYYIEISTFLHWDNSTLFAFWVISHKIFKQMTGHRGGATLGKLFILPAESPMEASTSTIYTYTIENWLSSFGTSVNIWQLKQQNCFQSPLQSRVPVQHIQHRPTKETWYSWKPADGGLMGASRATHAQQIFATAKFSKYSIGCTGGDMVVSAAFGSFDIWGSFPTFLVFILSIAVTPLDGGWR